MKYYYCIHRVAAIFCLCMLAAGSRAAAVDEITIDLPTKSATSASSKLTCKGVRVKGDQVNFTVKSTVPQPVKLKLKVTGLKPGEQDVFLDSSYVGKKTAEQLQAGIDLNISGRIVDPNIIRFMELTREKITAELVGMRKVDEAEHKRVVNTLDQAADWTRSALSADQSWRSVDVIVAPAGFPLEGWTPTNRMDSEDTLKAFVTAGNLLQEARIRMYTVINAPILSNAAVLAMTPVDYAMAYTATNGRPRLVFTLKNNCNLPVSGKVVPVVPDGWKAEPTSVNYSDLQMTKTLKGQFDLHRIVKGTAVPASFPVFANIELSNSKGKAVCTIRDIAKIPSATKAVAKPLAAPSIPAVEQKPAAK